MKETMSVLLFSTERWRRVFLCFPKTWWMIFSSLSYNCLSFDKSPSFEKENCISLTIQCGQLDRNGDSLIEKPNFYKHVNRAHIIYVSSSDPECHSVSL